MPSLPWPAPVSGSPDAVFPSGISPVLALAASPGSRDGSASEGEPPSGVPADTLAAEESGAYGAPSSTAEPDAASDQRPSVES